MKKGAKHAGRNGTLLKPFIDLLLFDLNEGEIFEKLWYTLFFYIEWLNLDILNLRKNIHVPIANLMKYLLLIHVTQIELCACAFISIPNFLNRLPFLSKFTSIKYINFIWLSKRFGLIAEYNFLKALVSRLD